MPVRSLNLKFIVPRSPSDRGVAKALWSTHAAVNAAVCYYESQLLLMRGRGYRISDDEVKEADEVRAALLQAAREAQVRNGGPEDPGEDDEVCRLLRALYEQIVPSAVGKQGSAQAANAFLSPLADRKSAAFKSFFKEIRTIPAWVDGARNGEADAFDQANEWLATEAGQARLHATGAPPKWARLQRQGDPGWPAAFVDALDRRLKEVEGTPMLVRRLKDLGVLPLFEPYLAPKIVGTRGKVTRWDRLAFRLAVSHLLSWESWCIRAANEYAQRKERVEHFQAQHIGDTIRPAIEGLERYQTERKVELDKTGLTMDRPFRINDRMVRAWPDLRQKWLRTPDRFPEKLLQLVGEAQRRLRGRFGDPH